MAEFKVNWYWIVKGDAPVFQLDKSSRILILDHSGNGSRLIEKSEKVTIPIFELEASVAGPLRIRDLVVSRLGSLLNGALIHKLPMGSFYGVIRHISQRGGPSIAGGGVLRDVGALGLFYSATRLPPLSGVKSTFMSPQLVKKFDLPDCVEGLKPPPEEKEIYRPSRFQREPVI